ncbi:2-hydroxy-6-oxononadienedioate/2-hydroxy-6-oxononatrienedioate hydrolase [Burkholderiales bacterium]|nr:2-hydroxy-6-oxononadienedioate/2-hydroxy-6-oxononatrienedioate hydrolase [Burkholderiales bacterium]
MTPVPTEIAIRSGRATLVAEAAGEGSPVVFLHAGVADRRMWRGQLDALARGRTGCRAIAYDRRGFGDTLHADERYSHVGDLLAVLNALAPRTPAILVGCSQGGRIAIDTELAHPARVRALLLVAPAISGAPEPTSLPPAIQAWVERVDDAEQASDIDRLNALEAHAWLDGPLEPEGRVGGPVRELFLAMNEIALRAEARGVETEPPDAWDRLHEIACPALVAWGDRDFPQVDANCRHLASRIPGARTHVMHGAAHLPNLEQPAAFDRMLLDFCASAR